MPPKKNKQGKNGFWPFALEIKSHHSNKHLSNQELMDIAGRKWANMSKEERKPYEQRAGFDKNNATNSQTYTSEGLVVEELQRQEKEVAEQTQDMKHNIQHLVKASATSGHLPGEVFLILHINHLSYYAKEERYFISEIAIAPFSLRDGVHVDNVFHSIVKPGKLPLGHYGLAKTHAKATHQMLDIVQSEPFDDNTHEVFKQLVNYLGNFRVDGKLPILYAQEKILDLSRKVFYHFCNDFRSPENISVYNLQYLFFHLKNAAAGRTVWPTETFAYSEIERDTHAYTTGISCDFHELTDVTLYCSRSIVIREGFIICDNCCADLKIHKIPGFHVPNKISYSDNRSETCSNFDSSEASFQTGYLSESHNLSTFKAEDFPSLGGNGDGWTDVGPSRSAWNRQHRGVLPQHANKRKF